MSSKKVETGSGEAITFDLGCTDFTADSYSFQRQVMRWLEERVVVEVQSPATAPFEKRYVGTPRGSALTRHLASALDIRFGTRISRLEREGGRWLGYIESQSGLPDSVAFSCSRIVLAIPPFQAAALLPAKHSLKDLLAGVTMLPQWVVMLATATRAPLHGHWQIPASDLIARCSLESRKPGRVSDFAGDIWQLQAKPAWTEQHIETDKNVVIAMLLEEFKRCLDTDVDVVASYAHRWLYSQRGARVVAVQDFLNSADGVSVCGDYLCNDFRFGGVEAAYTSAMALTESMLSDV
jgi:hypothetical protein